MPRAFIFCVIVTLNVAAVAAGAKSIFDDDWVPPKASESPRPIVVRPPAPAPADPPKPADPTATAPKDPVAPAPAVTSAARRAIPGKSEQATVRKALKAVFAEQLVDRSIAARRKLTQALLDQAEKSADAPVDRFVLLAASIDAGIEGVSLPLAFRAADRLAAAFEVDPVAIKIDTATRLSPKPGVTDGAAENVRAGLALADQLADAEDLAAATRVCAALTTVAAADPSLRGEVQRRQRDLTAARDANEKVVKFVEKLKAAPDDPTANLEVGKYLCSYRNDWKAALPMLARGSDAALKALATADVALPTSSEARETLGDRWAAAAKAAGGAMRQACAERAAY